MKLKCVAMFVVFVSACGASQESSTSLETGEEALHLTGLNDGESARARAIADFYEDVVGADAPLTCASLKDREWLPAWTANCNDSEEETPLRALLEAHVRASAPEWPVGIVSGGGVSMGSYQAGRLQGMVNRRRVDALQQVFSAEVLARDLVQLQRVDGLLSSMLSDTAWANLGISQTAGASAGGMNALGVAIEACRNTLVPTFSSLAGGPPKAQSTDSVLRLMWTDVGFDTPSSGGWADKKNLFASRPQNALFSAEPLDNVAEHLKAFFRRPVNQFALRNGCEIGLSITVTTLNPTAVKVGKGNFMSVTLPVMVTLKSAEGVLDVKGFPPPPRGRSIAAIPVDHMPPVTTSNVDALLELVKATGAIPPALPSRTLEQDDEGPISYNGQTFRVTVEPRGDIGRGHQLIDGGLLNNNPLDLILDRFTLQREALMPRPRIVFFDDDFHLPLPEPRKKYEGNSLYVSFERLLQTAWPVLNSQQVVSALRRPGFSIFAVGRESPALGRAAFATSAFVHRRLREFDYASGTIDGELESRNSSANDWSEADSWTWVSDVPLVRQLRELMASDNDNRTFECGASALSDPAHKVLSCLAVAAAAVDTEIERACQNPTSDSCSTAYEFAAVGHVLEGMKGGKALFEDVQTLTDTVARELSKRIDALASDQQSFLNLPGRALDLALETVLVDGLRFGNGLSDAKDNRVLRGWKNRSWLAGASDIRLSFDERFWGLELGWRHDPRLAAAWRLGDWQMGFGFVPAIGIGVGGGYTLSEGTSESMKLAGAYSVDASAMLLHLDNTAIALDLGLLSSVRVGRSTDRRGYDLRAGAVGRFTLVRMLSLETRVWAPMPEWGSSQRDGFVMPASWNWGLGVGWLL
jgi:hypothetical protein